MPARPGCILADYATVLNPDGSTGPYANVSVYVAPTVSSLEVQQADNSWLLLTGLPLKTVTDSSGLWTVTLPSQTYSSPASVTWVLSLPDGSRWTGAVTDAMVTASQLLALTLHDLATTYNWVQAQNIAFPPAPAPQTGTATNPAVVAPASGTPLATVAQDGTDSTDVNATQATGGVGLRGWLSTLVSLFRSGNAKVTINGTPTVNVGTPGLLARDSTLATVAQDATLLALQGTLPTGVAQDAGGSGLLGLLGSIKNAVQTAVAVTLTNALPTGANTVGKVYLTDGTNQATFTGAGALNVDGSAVTQPVSGTVTANVGTTNGLALDATLTGGTAQVKNREVASTFSTGQSPVTNTATLIHAATPTRNLLTVRNVGTPDMWIGGPGVTTGTGFLLHGGESQDVKAVGAVYGITASSSTTATYYEEVF